MKKSEKTLARVGCSTLVRLSNVPSVPAFHPHGCVRVVRSPPPSISRAQGFLFVLRPVSRTCSTRDTACGRYYNCPALALTYNYDERRKRRGGQTDAPADVAQVVHAKRGGRVPSGQHGAPGPASADLRTGRTAAAPRGRRARRTAAPSTVADAAARYRSQTRARDQGKHRCCRSPDMGILLFFLAGLTARLRYHNNYRLTLT